MMDIPVSNSNEQLAATAFSGSQRFLTSYILKTKLFNTKEKE